MRKLQLDIFKDTTAEITVDKNNNRFSVVFNSYHFIEEVIIDELPISDILQDMFNGIKLDNSFRILDYNTLILRKVKNMDNKLDAIVVKDYNDCIYVIINRVFVHHNNIGNSEEIVCFKIHNTQDDYIGYVKFNYPVSEADYISSGRTINAGLIGVYDGNYVHYIQCSNDTDIKNVGKMLLHNYNSKNMNDLIQQGDIVFLSERNTNNRKYIPYTKFKVVDLHNYTHLSYYYDNIYYYDETVQNWVYINNVNGIINTRLLKDII